MITCCNRCGSVIANGRTCATCHREMLAAWRSMELRMRDLVEKCRENAVYMPNEFAVPWWRRAWRWMRTRLSEAAGRH